MFEIYKLMTAADIQLRISISNPQRVHNCSLWNWQ